MILPILFSFGISCFSCLSPSFPSSSYVPLIPRHGIVPVLWGTFGYSPKTLDLIEVPYTLQVHFMNGSCQRFRRCKAGEFYKKLSGRDINNRIKRDNQLMKNRVLSRIRKIVTFTKGLKKQPRLILSTGLEDNFDKEAYLKLLEWFKEGYDGEISTNPLVRQKRAGIAFKELHGVSEKCDKKTIVNNDGFPIPAEEAFAWFQKHRGCGFAIFWVSSLQGVQKTFVSPRLRRFFLRPDDLNHLKEAL